LDQPFLQKYQNSKFQIFHKSLLREVHACQKILEFQVFIIFVYFLDVFSAGGGVGMRGKKWVSTVLHRFVARIGAKGTPFAPV
jgi:hypothetical protein